MASETTEAAREREPANEEKPEPLTEESGARGTAAPTSEEAPPAVEEAPPAVEEAPPAAEEAPPSSSGATPVSGDASDADASAEEAVPLEATPAEPTAADEESSEAPVPEATEAALDASALDTLFRSARTHNAWREEPVSDETLHELYELLKWGPTSANCSPARFLFLRTKEAKERLRPALSAGNVEKTMLAPVTVIIAYDPKFYDLLPQLFPHDHNAGSWFSGNEAFASETAFRNGSLQGAYLIMAARSLGLDCGPMSGFDRAKVDEEFFAYRGWKANFLCNLGHGDEAGLFARLPRLDFDEACELL